MSKPIDKDCDKKEMDDNCQECPMLVECYETNA